MPTTTTTFDEIAAVLDAVTCGPLGTPLSRAAATDEKRWSSRGRRSGVQHKFHGPALGHQLRRVLALVRAARSPERAGPAVRVSSPRPSPRYQPGPRVPPRCHRPGVAAPFGPSSPPSARRAVIHHYNAARRRVGEGDIDHLRRRSSRARALESGEASEECEVAERLGSILGREFFERDWEARFVWRRADGSGGARSCFRGSSPALAAPRWPAAAASSGDEPAPPPAKARAPRRGPRAVAGGRGEPLRRSYCRRVVDRPRTRPGCLAEDFALELLDDDRPP